MLDVGLTDGCRLDYTVTQADLDAGQITNAISATALDPSNPLISRTATITIPGPDNSPGVGALDVTKIASVTATTLGSVVTYELWVRNVSLITLSNIAVSATMIRADALLDVGETWVYTAVHTITQADINAGGISNTTDDPTEVPIAPTAALDLLKTVLQAGDSVGDVVTFQIAAINTGNVDLSGVTVSDSLTRADGTDIPTEVTGPTLRPPAMGLDRNPYLDPSRY